MARLGRRMTSLLGIAVLWGCTTWKAAALGPLPLAAFDSTKTYRLTLRSGARVVATHPTADVDSVRWVKPDTVGSRRAPRRTGVRLSDIDTIEVEQADNTGNALLAILGIAMLVAALTSPPDFGISGPFSF